jgi:pimeloyl-ACP methyl ester carboxylesterase
LSHALPACLAALLALAAGAAPAGELLNVATRSGVTQAAYVDGTKDAPPWVVVLFPGDNGLVRLADSGPTELKGNFVLRTTSFWRNAGDVPVIFDSPSDHASGMDDPFRLSDAHAADVKAVVAALRQRYPQARVALVGTSRGTISVGNVLKRDPGLADAYVLTSPVTGGKPPQSGLAGMNWSGVSAPVLVVANEKDGCRVSPFSAARTLAEDNKFRFLSVSSSDIARGANDCQARTPHGYLGIEDDVLKSIHDWLSTAGSRSPA